MKTALIISLNFHPGHVSHLVASYKQCEEIGFKAVYFVDERFRDFLPNGSSFVTSLKRVTEAALAIFTFPSQKNLKYIWQLKRRGTKVVYIFHEPLAPMKVYRQAGFSWKYLAKLWIIDRISAFTVKWSDAILLPSNKAVNYYKNNQLYKNEIHHYLPLMFDDEQTEQHRQMERLYFSYLGTVAADHSFQEYLDFVTWAVRKNKLEDVKFLIATKSDFDIPDALKDSVRVTIQKGRPLTNDEINAFYAQSIVVWNAYERTTQSGVLAKSFMFGTPAIVLKKNLSEYTVDKQEVVAIGDNNNVEEIILAVEWIISNNVSFNKACRDRFLNTFYYRKYNEELKKLIVV